MLPRSLKPEACRLEARNMDAPGARFEVYDGNPLYTSFAIPEAESRRKCVHAMLNASPWVNNINSTN